jgi:hypothetical protein
MSTGGRGDGGASSSSSSPPLGQVRRGSHEALSALDAAKRRHGLNLVSATETKATGTRTLFTRSVTAAAAAAQRQHGGGTGHGHSNDVVVRGFAWTGKKCQRHVTPRPKQTLSQILIFNFQANCFADSLCI